MATKDATNRIKPLKLSSSSRTLAAKFYEEQLPGGEDAFINAVKNSSSNERQILAIKHTQTKAKQHWHLIERLVDDGDNIYVNTALHDLGVYYRKGIDDELIKNHGLESVGFFENYAAYLLHTTDKAREEGKTEYPIESFVTNLSLEEVKRIVSGYASKKQRMTRKDYISSAKKAGYELMDFDTYISSFPQEDITVNIRKAMLAEFIDSAEQRLADAPFVNRLNVYIVSDVESKDEKSRIIRGARKALEDKTTALLSDGKKGIHSDTDAVICDKYTTQFSTNSVIGFKLENDYRIWKGQYDIVVGNKNEIRTISEMFSSERHYEKEFDARFFICQIEEGKLVPTHAPIVQKEYAEELKTLYKDFRDRFNEAYITLDEKKEAEFVRINIASLK